MQPWLDRLRREIEEATGGLSEAAWGRAPEGRWNSAQIMEHLGRTYGGTAKMVEKHLSGAGAAATPSAEAGQLKTRPGAPPTSRSVTLRERWLQFLVIGMSRFPSERQAPSFALPKGMAGAVALQNALNGLDRMSTALDAAEQRWGSGQRIGEHVFFGPLTIAQWKKFHYLHGHHHMQQIRARAGK